MERQAREFGLDIAQMGADKKKKLTKKLPQHFPSILPEGVCDKVTRLWQVSGSVDFQSKKAQEKAFRKKRKLTGSATKPCLDGATSTVTCINDDQQLF